MDLIAERKEEMQQLLSRFSSSQAEGMQALAGQIAELFSRGGQLLVAGGGQMQSLVPFLVNAFTFRLEFDRPSLPAIALGTDNLLNTRLSAANMQDQCLVRYYRSLASDEHLLVLLNDGSESAAMDLLCEEVLENDQPLALISSCGEEDPFYSKDLSVKIDLGVKHFARQQELGLYCAHLLCELVEKELFSC